jgi:hypothetical protein
MPYLYYLKLGGVSKFKNGHNNIIRNNQNSRDFPVFPTNDYTEGQLLEWAREKYGTCKSVKIMKIVEV